MRSFYGYVKKTAIAYNVHPLDPSTMVLVEMFTVLGLHIIEHNTYRPLYNPLVRITQWRMGSFNSIKDT